MTLHHHSIYTCFNWQYTGNKNRVSIIPLFWILPYHDIKDAVGVVIRSTFSCNNKIHSILICTTEKHSIKCLRTIRKLLRPFKIFIIVRWSIVVFLAATWTILVVTSIMFFRKQLWEYMKVDISAAWNYRWCND